MSKTKTPHFLGEPIVGKPLVDVLVPETKKVPLIEVQVISKRVAEQIPRLIEYAGNLDDEHRARILAAKPIADLEGFCDVLCQEPNGKLIRVHSATFICIHGMEREKLDAQRAILRDLPQVFFK